MSPTPGQERRSKLSCALCRTSRSSTTGEHVLPRQVTNALFPESSGPFTTNRPEGPIVRKQFDSIKLPCCLACNAELNIRFEATGAAPAIRLMSADEPALTRGESDAAASWLLKTWLLLGHPDSEFQAATPRPDPWDGAPTDLYSWLITKSPPPPGLSMWACRLRQQPAAAGTQASLVHLPTVTTGGHSTRFRHLELAVGRLNVAVVYHPGWEIELPSEAAGGPRRIWPLGQSIEALPQYNSRPIRWTRGPDLMFIPGTYEAGGLPPLVPNVQPDELVRPLLLGAAAPPVGRR